MEIDFLKPAYKYMESCDKHTRIRLLKAIYDLPDGDVKKMQGSEAEYRLRVGSLRIIYLLEENIITIEKILPRGQVYKRIKEECSYGNAGIE